MAASTSGPRAPPTPGACARSVRQAGLSSRRCWVGRNRSRAVFVEILKRRDELGVILSRALSVLIESERALIFYFDAFSSREPISTSLENALAAFEWRRAD